VLDGSLTVGVLLVFLAYLASLYAPLESIMYTSMMIQGAAGSARRVLEILDTVPEVQERRYASTLVGRSRGEVLIEEAVAGYEAGQEPVLKGVSLEALSGQTVAIVGPTGAGKSTLASLVPRLLDVWGGRVCLDGQDVRQLRLRELRRQVAVVLQEPFLFPMTVWQNIAYGRPDASEREVREAARRANAEEFIERLEQGYQTVLGPRGATLSGGQRQRLAIARALLSDAPVLVLDEPTASLDAECERLVLEALGRLRAGRTTLVIAHRLSTVRDADRIVVLERGRVVESGTHTQLAAAGGLYARYWGLQSGASEASTVVLAPVQGRSLCA
jgi:ATP-binding cassette subfamily B protein/subfamily B ATP-binding cassette protein MsbA